MIITHQVEDGARWLAAFRPPTSRQQMFEEHGVSSVRNFQNSDDPNLTGLLLEIADMGAFTALMDSPETATAKAEDGVKDATRKMFYEVK